MLETQTAKARHVELSAEEYHAHPAIGSSMLEVFRRSRREYHARFITKTLEQTTSPALELGTLVHMLLLEPEIYAETVAFLPPDCGGEEWNWRLKAHRETRDAILEGFAAEGKRCIEPELHLKVQNIVNAIRGNWHARRLVNADGQREFSIFWTDPYTGLELKCRVDWYAAIPLDIKTACDPSPMGFSKAAANLSYFCKAAHYAHGIAAYAGEPIPMVHLVAETTAPFRVAVYELDDRDLSEQSLGRSQWRRALNDLKWCIDSGDFREEWEKRIVTLRPPTYAFTQDQYDL
jgi:hypothetical protein